LKRIKATNNNIIGGIHYSVRRKILGVSVSNSETGSTWSEVFVDLKRRGLRGVELVVSDAQEGLKSTMERHFQSCPRECCVFQEGAYEPQTVRKCLIMKSGEGYVWYKCFPMFNYICVWFFILCIEKSEEWEKDRRYLNMGSMKIDNFNQQKSPIATLLSASAEEILEA